MTLAQQFPTFWRTLAELLGGMLHRFAYLDEQAGKTRERSRSGNESAFGSMQVYTGEYSFAVDGGAISLINLTAAGIEIPIGAIVRRAWIEVLTVVTSGGAATISLGIETPADLLAATLVSGSPYSTATPKDLPLASATPAIKTAAARRVTMTIAAFALTAGRFRVHVEYLDTRA